MPDDDDRDDGERGDDDRDDDRADDDRDDDRDDDDRDDDGIMDLLVPASFSVTVPKRDDGPTQLRAHNFEALKHRAVVVIANGFTYRGVFVGADDDDVYLRGEMRWWVLPLSSVTTVRRDPERDDDDVDVDDKA